MRFIIMFAIIFGLIIFSVILLIPKNNSEKYKHPVITEYDFSIGNIENTKECIYANPCNDKVLYPINQPNVDYDNTYPSNCKCLEFIESP